MATAKRAKKNKHFWEHEYVITKVDPTLRKIEVVTVLGSRDASAKQEEFEDQGYFAIVYNNTNNDEEYRTPGCEDFEEKA
jgi:hypothetical protein